MKIQDRFNKFIKVRISPVAYFARMHNALAHSSLIAVVHLQPFNHVQYGLVDDPSLVTRVPALARRTKVKRANACTDTMLFRVTRQKHRFLIAIAPSIKQTISTFLFVFISNVSWR